MRKSMFSVLFLVSLLFGLGVVAQNIKMPNGKIYENPIVMGQTPLGLDIGYKDGVAFWKFVDLPENIQKKYGYDPVKAAAYEKALKDKKAAAMAREVAKEAENEKFGLEDFAEQVKLYGMKIQNVEKQIQDYKERMAKFESKETEDENRVMSLADTAMKTSENNSSDGWGYATFNNGGSSLQQVMAVRTSDTFRSEADDDHFQANALRIGCYQLEHDLPVMKDTYGHMQVRLKSMQAHAANKSAPQPGATKTKAVDFKTLEQHLSELTELHRKGLISDDEYKAKQGEIVNAM